MVLAFVAAVASAVLPGTFQIEQIHSNAAGATASVTPGQQPVTVAVVEYYNAGLDHYFMTASSDDITVLDAGLFPGWARTQQSFKAFLAQGAGLSPVCRFYIPPIHGDSHFFSAQPSDCAALLAWAADPAKFPNFSGYVEEHAAAFYVTLPDATGACPTNTVPVFRLWNQRFDSNHRYTTSQAIVAQMQARNYVLEGPLPNQAAMCAPGDPQPPAASRYFANDTEADALRRGNRTVQMPLDPFAYDFGLQWRIINAERMLGLEVAEIARGQVIDAAAFKDIDQHLATREALFDADAARLPDYAFNWSPNFRDNIPRTFGVHMAVRVLDSFNAGPIQYQRITNSCLLANMVPQMCGALVDFGTVDGSACTANTSALRNPQVIQFPELYGFWSVRRAIRADELPVDLGIPSTCQYAATLVHEFVHDLDGSLNDAGPGNPINAQFDRLQACSINLFDFAKPGNPFDHDGGSGMQNPAEYVSGYAAGLSNPGQDYRRWEDAAETVTAYILFPEYFRRLAAANAKLQARYDYVKAQIFGNVEFDNLAVAPEAKNLTRPTSAMDSICSQVHQFRMDDVIARPR
jgi:hypothetical protein